MKIAGYIIVVMLLLQGITARAENFEAALVAAAIERTHHNITYNGAYYSLAYPGGDVPEHIGVCTDVVIRSYRQLGVDLQQQVHEDMKENFDAYPSKRIWGLGAPDSNIDHRRVPHLQIFFSRHGQSLTVSRNAGDYKPGDLVTWLVGGNLPHIGIVTDRFSAAGNPMVVHNIGAGPKLEDMLFDFKITGHYRYRPVIAMTEP